MGDAASCVGIIVGAVIIHYTGWLKIDPILSIVISLVIVWTAWDIFKDSLNILLEGLPKGLAAGRSHLRHPGRFRRDRRARSARLESGRGGARAELSRAD